MAPTERTTREFRSFNFKGEHRSIPDLVDAPDYADACINLRVNDRGDLVGTEGFSVASPEIRMVDTRNIYAGTQQWNNQGLFKFYRPQLGYYATSSPEEIMLAAGGKAAVQYKLGKVKISPLGNGYGISFYAKDNGGAKTYVLDLLDDAGTVLQSKSFAVGGASFATDNLLSLRTFINTQPGWSCTITPSAVVNGAGVKGYTTGLTVSSVALISKGDFVRLNSTSFAFGYADVMVTDISGNDLYFASLTANVNVTNGAQIGATNLPVIGTMPICHRVTTREGSGFIEIPFLIAAQPAPYETFFETADIASSVRRWTSASLNGSLYIGGSPSWGQEDRLMKFDGSCLGYAGAAKQSSCTLAMVAGGALTAGATYRYAVVMEKIDANGFVIRSQPYELSTPSVVGGTQTSRITIPANVSEYETHTAVSSTVSAVATTTLAIASWDLFQGANFGIGAYLHVPSNADQNVVQRTKISAIRGNQVTVETGVTINSAVNSRLSQGAKLIFFKTVANGDIYYKYAERTLSGASQTVDDANGGTTADTAVVANERLVFPAIGLENDPPPSLPIITAHQDLLVGAGARSDPSSVFFSTSESPEYMPIASNSQSVPDTSSGVVTAICSDTGSRLSIFKDRSIYSAIGDFRTGLVQIEGLSSGGIGCSSPTGVVKKDEWTYFVSRKGIARLQNGQLDEGFNAATVDWFSRYQENSTSSASFIPSSDNFNFALQHATCIDDTERRRLLFRVPSEGGDFGSSGTADGFPGPSKQTIFCFDYLRQAWSRLVGDAEHFPSVGMVTFNNRLFGAFCGWSPSQLFSATSNLGSGMMTLNDTGSVYDFSAPGAGFITSFLALRADSVGSPSVKKQWIDGLIYSTGAMMGLITPPSSGAANNFYLSIYGKENFDPIDRAQMAIQLSATESPAGALRHQMTTVLAPTEIAGSASVVDNPFPLRVYEPMASYFRFANNQAVAMKIIVTNLGDLNYATQVNRPPIISGIDINVALPYKMDASEKATRWK